MKNRLWLCGLIVLCAAASACFASTDSASALNTNGRKCVAAVSEITRELVKDVEMQYVASQLSVGVSDLEVSGYKLVTISSNSWLEYSSGTQADACKDAFLNGNFGGHYREITPDPSTISAASIRKKNADGYYEDTGWGYKGTGTDGDTAACLNLVRFSVETDCDFIKNNWKPDCHCTDPRFYNDIITTGKYRDFDGKEITFREDTAQFEPYGHYNGKLDGTLAECTPPDPPPDEDEPETEIGITKTQTCAINDYLGESACDPIAPEETDPDDPKPDEFQAVGKDEPSSITEHDAPTQLARPGDLIYFEHYFDKGAQKLADKYKYADWVKLPMGAAGSAVNNQDKCNEQGMGSSYFGPGVFSGTKGMDTLAGNTGLTDGKDCVYVSGPVPADVSQVEYKHRFAADETGVPASATYPQVLKVSDDCFITGKYDFSESAPTISTNPGYDYGPDGVPALSNLSDVPSCSKSHDLANQPSKPATVSNADVGTNEIYQKVTIYDRVAQYLLNCPKNDNGKAEDCKANYHPAGQQETNAKTEVDTNTGNSNEHKIYVEWRKHNGGSCSGGCCCSCTGCCCRCSGTCTFYGAGDCGSCSCPGNCSNDGKTFDNYDSGVYPYTEYEHSWVKMVDNKAVSSNAQFNIPYNYQLVPEIDAVELPESMIIGGADWDYTTQIHTISYHNEEFDEDYATITRPGTHWEVTEFYIGENEPMPNNFFSQVSNDTAPCSHYKHTSGIQNVQDDCRKTDEGTGPLNGRSGAEAESSVYLDEEAFMKHTAHVADAPAGTKFCIGLSVYDEFSYYTVNGGDASTYGDDVKGHWVHHAPVCASIAKIPTMQVWGGGLYSEGVNMPLSGIAKGAVIGRYAEKLNASASTYEEWSSSSDLDGPDDLNYGVDGWRAFGSFGEYDAIGSNRNNSSLDATLRLYGSATAFGHGLSIAQPFGGGTSSTSGCAFSKLSIKNTPSSCTNPNNTDMGNSTAFRGLAQRVALRYTNRVQNNQWITGDTAKVDSITGEGYADGDHGTWNGGAITPQSGEITYYHHNDSTTINATNIGKGKTVIVEIEGTATIKGNITYADADNNPNNNYYTSETMTSIYDIPQVIIFANNIDIEPQVTQIDAWLMVGIDHDIENRTATKLEYATKGEINTCANGIKEDTLIAANGQYGTDIFYAATPVNEGTWSRACNQRLKVNGPVQAKKLRLLRSYGAGMGLDCNYDYKDKDPVNGTTYTSSDQAQWPNGGRTGNCVNFGSTGTGSFPYDSATPAEVFNLRADTYLWAYKQVENYSQAFVTYSREVAPRY